MVVPCGLPHFMTASSNNYVTVCVVTLANGEQDETSLYYSVVNFSILATGTAFVTRLQTLPGFTEFIYL